MKGKLSELTMNDMVLVPPNGIIYIDYKVNLTCLEIKKGKYNAHFELCQSLENMHDILLYTSLGKAFEKHNALFYSRVIRSNNFILEVK
jgi:hypothetical protein